MTIPFASEEQETFSVQIFARRVLSDGISPHGFIDERFATVRPRLVAGRFIRKGSPLSFVAAVSVWYMLSCASAFVVKRCDTDTLPSDLD